MAMEGAGLQGPKGMMMLNGMKGKFAIMDTGVSYALIPSQDFSILIE